MSGSVCLCVSFRLWLVTKMRLQITHYPASKAVRISDYVLSITVAAMLSRLCSEAYPLGGGVEWGHFWGQRASHHVVMVTFFFSTSPSREATGGYLGVEGDNSILRLQCEYLRCLGDRDSSLSCCTVP